MTVTMMMTPTLTTTTIMTTTAINDGGADGDTTGTASRAAAAAAPPRAKTPNNFPCPYLFMVLRGGAASENEGAQVDQHVPGHSSIWALRGNLLKAPLLLRL